MIERLLLTIPEAAEALSVSERTIRYMLTRGELAPVVHIGRSVRIPVTTLRAFIEKCTTAANTRPAGSDAAIRSRIG